MFKRIGYVFIGLILSQFNIIADVSDFNPDKESVKIIQRELIYSFDGKKNSLTERNVFHLLDASAVRDFGDFYSHHRDFEILVVKKDGTIRKINTENIIETEAEVSEKYVFGFRYEKKRAYKLAISGLEVGDQLDVTIRQNEIKSYEIGYRRLFAGMYFIENNVISFRFRGKHYFEYEMYNCDDVFESVDSSDFTTYKLNIDSIEPLSIDRFTYPFKENSYVKLFYDAQPQSSGKGDLMREFQIPDYTSIPEQIGGNSFLTLNPENAYKKITKNKGLKVEERIDALYSLLKIYYLYLSPKTTDLNLIKEEYNESRNFALRMFYIITSRELDVECEVVCSSSRFLNEKALDRSMIWSVRVKFNDNWKYFNMPKLLLNNGDDNKSIEGVVSQSYRLNREKMELEFSNEFKFPISNYMDNRVETKIEVSLSNHLMNGLKTIDIHLDKRIMGELKDELIFASLRTEAYKYGREHKLFTRRMRESITKLFSPNYPDRYNNFDYDDYFKLNPVMGADDYEDFTMATVQLFDGETSLRYKMDVRRSEPLFSNGKLIILNLGTFIGEQLHLDKRIEQNTRTKDFHFSCPRSFMRDIEIQIPHGYDLDINLDYLNMEVVNEYGSFISKAAIEGDKLICRVEKIYYTNYIPFEKADKLYDFTDASNDFFHKRIILKKWIKQTEKEVNKID